MDSLDRSAKGVNVIQYMPTASLMTYVMGLDAAKSRPATEKERAEMARLLDEGMDAGLCGFSIQRLGPNSVQADFDGSPMVTDTMCDEDIFNLARVLRRRDEGFMEITQGYRQRPSTTSVSSSSLADEALPPDPVQAVVPTRNNPEIHRRSLRWIEPIAPRAAIFSARVRTGPQRFRLLSRELEPLRHAARMAHAEHRHQERSWAKMKDPELRAAVTRQR